MSFLLPIISIHAALKDFLYRFPFIIWVIAICPLLFLIFTPLRRKFLLDVNTSSKRLIGVIFFSIALFSTFIEVNNSNAVDLKFENLNKLLTFFEESRFAILKNTSELNYLESIGKTLSKPRRSNSNDNQRFQVFFNGSKVTTKEISFSNQEIQRICDISFGLKTNLLIDSFKKIQGIPRSYVTSINQILRFDDQCHGSAMFIWYKEAVRYILESQNQALPLTERSKNEIGFYNHVSKLDQRKLSESLALIGSIPMASLDSNLANGSQFQGSFFNYTSWDESLNDCIQLIAQNIGFSSFIRLTGTEHEANKFKVFYPGHLLYPTLLLDEGMNFIFEVNLATKKNRTFCIIGFNDKVNFKRMVIDL